MEPINEKNKDYSQEFVHLVGLYTHCNMMHGIYNVKQLRLLLHDIELYGYFLNTSQMR